MKKNNLLVLFALTLLLNSCKTELDSFQENEILKQEAKFSLLRIEQINQQINLLSKLSEVELNAFRTTDILGRSVQDSILESVIINTNEVLLAERGEKKTYTFPVYRTNSGKIENLVLKENTDKTYSGFLIQYDLTKEEKDLFISGQNVDIKSKIKIFNIDKLNLSARVQSDVVGCYEITWETGTCSSSQHHAYGDNTCVLTGDDAAPKPTIIAIKDICSNYGTQGDSPYSNPNFPNDGSSGSYDTAPYIGSEAELIEMNRVFRLKLNTAQLSWYDGHTVLGMDLAKLYNEDNSNPHLNFLRLVIDYMKTSNNAQDTFLYATIINFLKQNGSYQENWALIKNIFAEYNPNLGISVLNFVKENPDTQNIAEIINRINALDNALAINPNLLLDIPCSQLPDWQTLANHPIPTSVKNKIFQINDLTGWFSSAAVQNLDYSTSYTINMDVYPVKISDMPKKPSGVRYTPAEFFDYFRKNINIFTDINHGNFYPVVAAEYGIDDNNLWFSSNPLNALITIKIPADNGTVICSGWGSQAWIFTTVKSPWDGEHPVSGNRLFGYFIDANGDMFIYTRGVDRFTTKFSNNGMQYTIENFGYSAAKDMWKNMQQKLKIFVNNNGGTSSVISGVDYQPNYIFIKDYLKGQKPITALGCH
nr:hypothetical protein [uncultured Chryseobacterium sp.]